MGNCNLNEKKEAQEDLSVQSIHNFVFQDVIGRGGFGKVWKVRKKKNKMLYALKIMSKAKIVQKKSVNSVMNERLLLSNLRHPQFLPSPHNYINHRFLINMVCAFQDKDCLYLFMDLLTGGDLRYHIGRHRKFNEEQTKFYAACIIVGLEYLHQNGILHRDIKPENLVFDNRGYLRLTDLGIARIWKPENQQDTSGTPGYMAPEVMCRHNHGVAVDYFALGVIVYECMMGKRPYLGRSRQEIRDQILAKQVQIKKQEVPVGWSLESADFANKLIQRKPQNRLGCNGPEEVKDHAWFKDYQWDKILNKEFISPFIPDGNEDNYIPSSSNRKDSDEENLEENQLMLRRNSIQNLFSGYNCDNSQPTTAMFMGSSTAAQSQSQSNRISLKDSFQSLKDKDYKKVQV